MSIVLLMHIFKDTNEGNQIFLQTNKKGLHLQIFNVSQVKLIIKHHVI